jgi:tetratricopeptide (TPR) repeat protein
VAEEGVALEAFVDEGLDGADAAHRAAHLLGDHFDGLVVALIPAQVNDPEGWREAIKILASGSWPVRVRWAVLSPPSGPLADILGEEGARLQLEPGAVLAFLKQTAPPGTFQALMLEAAEAQAAGRPEEAAGIYREARVLCRAEGQREAESIVLVAYAGACLAAGAAGLAAHSYHEAAQIAEEAGAWSLACQAWLGMGGALVARGKHRSAGVAYRTAAALAKRAGAEPLEAEALRLAAELSAPKEVQP